MGGWDGLPLQQQSQLKVFIKLQPLFLQCLAEPHFPPPVCICQAPSSYIPNSAAHRFTSRGQNKLVGDIRSSLEKARTCKSRLKVLSISSKVYCRLTED